MLLSEIFEYLTYGELAHINLGGGGTDEIGVDPTNYPKLVTNINLGLIELYKRFPIKEDEVSIQLYSHITNYILTDEYAESNTDSNKPYKYIQDGTLIDKFNNNILLIVHVYDELGEEFPLNDIDDTVSLFTPTMNTLQVPFPDNENTLSVIYRASPTKINHIGLSEPSTIEVDLPEQFLEALCAYVGYRIFAPLNIGKNVEANSHYAKFEAACALINNLGLYVADTNTNLKFGENGWL